MKRDPAALRGQEFDVLIVGGGAFAACAVWEAVLRNYSVALIEANDFASGTSANSFKFVHGGIRYLQHLDLTRLRASCRERSALLRIAPHLVKPLPVAIPTYGYGRNGKALLGAGFRTYDLLTMGRNRGITDVRRHIPRTSFMSRNEVLRRFEGIEAEGLTGAAVFNDAQMYHPPRLVLSFIMSAVEKGAVALNYVAAKSFVRRGNRITGAIARDRLTGEEFPIRARVVLNAAGPWAEDLLQTGESIRLKEGGVYSRDTCFLIDGAPEPEYAVAVQGSSVDTGSLIGRASRHLFVVPWRGRRLIGVWHVVYRNGADRISVSEQELEKMLREFNGSLGALNIRREDIRLVNAGLVPFGESDEQGDQLAFGKRSHLVDSAERHNLEGLVTLIGVRHTMARGDALKAIGIIDRKLKRRGESPDSAYQPLSGGDIKNFDKLVRSVREGLSGSGNESLAGELAALYGSRAPHLLAENLADEGRLGTGDILAVQISTAIRDELAVTLSDVVFRRTPLAAAGNPGIEVVRACADQMGNELGWSVEEREHEINAVMARFPTLTHAGRISEPVRDLPRVNAACLGAA